MTGWKTKTAAILGMVGAVVGMLIYFIGGPEATGAISLQEGIPALLGFFAIFGFRDALTKLLGPK